jgi:hypothetical protein
MANCVEQCESVDAVVVCCDKPLVTPFCPQCGRKNEGVIGELLTYFNEKKAMHEKRQARVHNEPSKQRAQRSIDRYARWIAAVRQLLAVTAWKQ